VSDRHADIAARIELYYGEDRRLDPLRRSFEAGADRAMLEPDCHAAGAVAIRQFRAVLVALLEDAEASDRDCRDEPVRS
jgi:hypothetical protein